MQLRRKVVSLLATAAVLGGALVGSSPASATPPPSPHPTPAFKDVVLEKMTPPKFDPKRDKLVQASTRSAHFKQVPSPNPPTAKMLTPCASPCYNWTGRHRTSSNVTAMGVRSSIITSSLDQWDYHTLWEMTVQNDCNIIELGDNRDRVVNGDVYPALTTHLFGSVWYCDASGNRTFCGYNGGCGYADYGPNPINLGSDITSQNNVQKLFEIVYDSAGHRWWLYYDTDWVGSWPDDLQHGQTFTSGSFLQTFDEMVSSRLPSCSDEGNSWLADTTKTFPQTGQQVFSLNEATGGGTFSLVTYGGTVQTDATKWRVANLSNSSYYSGGPGASPNPGACPP